jgi:uncharacterized membrane protein
MDESQRAVDDRRSVARLVAFSDGVFAIAMTLLVLNLSVPDVHGADQGAKLWAAIREQAPEFFSYALSFAVIGRYWVVHHRIFRVVVRSDGRLLSLNLLLLGCVALIPYPTEALGRYGDTTTAVVLYSTTLMLTGLANAAITWHLDHADLLDPRVSDSYRRHSRVRAVTLPLIFGLSIPIAFFDPSLAMISWAVSGALLTLYGTRRYGRIAEPFSG